MGLVQDITPWNQPAAKVPTRQAEEQLTAVRFEHATGNGEEQQREPVSILKPNTDPHEAVKNPARETIVPIQLTVQEAFLTEDWDPSPTPRAPGTLGTSTP